MRRLRQLLRKRSLRWSRAGGGGRRGGAAVGRAGRRRAGRSRSTSRPKGAASPRWPRVAARAFDGGGPGLRPRPRGHGAGRRHGLPSAGAGRRGLSRRRLGTPRRGRLGGGVRDVRDPGNAGTVIRTADAAGCRRCGVLRRHRRPLQSQDGAGHGRVALPRPRGRRGPARRRDRRLSGGLGLRTLGAVVRDGVDYVRRSTDRSGWPSCLETRPPA